MRKWTLWILTAAFLALSFALMSSTAWLKKPLRPGEDVLALIDALDRATDVSGADWDEAESIRQELKAAWESVRLRIQFVAEKDDVVRFGQAVDELRGSIIARDLPSTKRTIENLRSVWHSMR